MAQYLQTGIRFRLTLWVSLMLGAIWLPASLQLMNPERSALSAGAQDAFLVNASNALPTIVLLLFCLTSLIPLVRHIRQTLQLASALEQGNSLPISETDCLDELRDLALTLGRIAHRSTRVLRQREQEQKQFAREQQNLNHQAVHDELTGLRNRKYGRDMIAQLDGDDSDASHSILFIDLDGFKPINDTYGHAVGDEILIAVSMRIRAILHDGAELIRWGGDEFVIILPDTDLRKAISTAQDVADLFKHPLAVSCGVLPLGCSIGVATSAPGQAMEDVLEEADGRMYQQKQRRKGASRSEENSAVDGEARQCAMPRRECSETLPPGKAMPGSTAKDRQPVSDSLNFSDDQVMLKFFDSAA